jgi:serine/threonine protein kinase
MYLGMAAFPPPLGQLFLHRLWSAAPVPLVALCSLFGRPPVLTPSPTVTYLFAGGHTLPPLMLPLLQDVYSWAIIMCEMLTGQPPWLGCNNMAIMASVVVRNERPDLPSNPERCPPDLASLINDCWKQDPRDRPSTGEIVKLISLIMKVGSVTWSWPARVGVSTSTFIHACAVYSCHHLLHVSMTTPAPGAACTPYRQL